MRAKASVPFARAIASCRCPASSIARLPARRISKCSKSSRPAILPHASSRTRKGRRKRPNRPPCLRRTHLPLVGVTEHPAQDVFLYLARGRARQVLQHGDEFGHLVGGKLRAGKGG